MLGWFREVHCFGLGSFVLCPAARDRQSESPGVSFDELADGQTVAKSLFVTSSNDGKQRHIPIMSLQEREFAASSLALVPLAL